MEATTLNILVDYTGCESEKDRAEVLVTARHKARLQMATHPELLDALVRIKCGEERPEAIAWNVITKARL